MNSLYLAWMSFLSHFDTLNIPSFKIETVLKHRKPANNLFELYFCNITAENLSYNFTFTLKHFYIVRRFLLLCKQLKTALKTFYELQLYFPNLTHKQFLSPLLRILSELVDKYSVTIIPDDILSFVNATNNHFVDTPDKTTCFRTFLIQLSDILKVLHLAPISELKTLINNILANVDTAFCMTLAYFLFFTKLRYYLKNPITTDFLPELLVSKFNQFYIGLANRTKLQI